MKQIYFSIHRRENRQISGENRAIFPYSKFERKEISDGKDYIFINIIAGNVSRFKQAESIFLTLKIHF